MTDTISKKTTITKKQDVRRAKKINKKTVDGNVVLQNTTPQSKDHTIRVDIFDTAGNVVGKQALEERVFGQKVNKPLIAQAVRVYLANQRLGTASTKTRGEVSGSTRKIYRQKGTGRARHGGIGAPVFVGGGVAHGPKPRDYRMSLPQKMKQKALASALSAKVVEGEIKIVKGLDKLEGKTKAMATTLMNLDMRGKKQKSREKHEKVLFVVTDAMTHIVRAARNLDRVRLTSAHRLHVYDILTTKHVVFLPESLEALEKRLNRI